MKSVNVLSNCNDSECRYYDNQMDLFCSYSEDNTRCYKIEFAERSMNDAHVGYCRYLKNDGAETFSIELCNSDDDGAFKVYRESDRALLEEAVKIIKQCDNLEYDSDRMESFLARAKERLGK